MPARRLLAVLIVALVSAAFTFGLSAFERPRDYLDRADFNFYDSFFARRPIESRRDGPIVVLDVDQKSLDEIEQKLQRGWPWPRESWALVIDYLQNAGAKAVVFDVLFSETSNKGPDDDTTFAAAIDDATVPLVFARVPSKPGATTQATRRFAPPVTKPVTLAGVDTTEGFGNRDYFPASEQDGTPSLALAALQAAGLAKPGTPPGRFGLHYYGPVERAIDGKTVSTYTRVAASRVILAALDAIPADAAPPAGIFKDKIVFIGLTAPGLYDLKTTPVADRFHGVQIHATAADNLLEGRSVRRVSGQIVYALVTLASLIVAAGTVLPRSALAKTIVALAVMAVIVGVSFVLFRGHTIYWLPPALPLATALMATAGGLTYSYAVEDRKARFLLKALESSLSPAVAAELARDPSKLATGGRRVEMTLMFTDLHGFTDLTEKLRERIEPLLNFYLAEMTRELLKTDATVDKYIGDAIMSFWNAPLPQPDHAKRACRAALALKQREIEITPKLHQMGARFVQTRIGINTGDVVVGFMGNAEKLSYTAIGDPVNLAARLEPANKLYGTQILVSGNTVDQAGDGFLFRQVDVLKVKGKAESVRVYELIATVEAATTQERELVARHAAAFERYQARDFAGANAALVSLLADFPHDPPSEALRERLAYYTENPPAADWDGAYESKTK